MRKLIIKNHNNKSTHSSLIFFAQALEELLFDHSDDSYKAPALSTPARTGELIRLVRDNDDAGISLESIKPFVEELSWSISKELVLTNVEKDFCTNLCQQLVNDIDRPELIISKLKTIRLEFENYLQKILQKINQCLLVPEYSKNEIYLLATQLVSHAEYEGYHRRYLSLVAKKSLTDPLARRTNINTQNLFDNFKSKFEGRERDWIVYVYTDSDIRNYTNQSGHFGIKIETELTFPDETPYRDFNVLATPERCLISIVDIKAYDADKARDIAIEILEGFISTISFCCHDRVINYVEPVLLKDKTTDFWMLIDKRPHPMIIGNRSNAEEAVIELDNLITPLINRKLAPYSTRKLLNAFEYHRAALESRLPENQLVDLWAALEGLLPSPDGVRIKFFCNTLSSVLTLTYTEKLLKVFEENLNHETTRVKRIIGSITTAGTSNFEKVVALVSARELEQHRIDIAALIANDNPLLLYRFFELNQQFKSKKHIGKSLTNHQQKINWHIHRIYHSRNMIVHSAESLPYLPRLVENLHLYLDTLIHAITKLTKNHNITDRRTIDVDTAVATLAAHEKFLIHNYTISNNNPDVDCDLSNFWDLVFGTINPLAPIRATIT